jgi:hypothetical protein
VPWLLATLTLALALAGPAYADSLGGEEIAEAEAMLAAEIPEAPVEEPPELSEPPVEPAEAPPAEPVPTPVDAPPAEPLPAVPAEEPMTPGPGAQSAAPEPTAPVEELASESDEQGPALLAEDDGDDPAPSVVVPLNLNVDIRILSPGDDGDVTQIIDMGQLPGLGSGNPADVLRGLDLGLDWTWNWNWTWDCGDTSIAGLDWNWNWSWSGDCAGGMMDEPGSEDGPFGERSRSERDAALLEALSLESLEAPPELDAQRGPLVTMPAAGRSTPVQRDKRDEAETAPAPPPSSGDGGLPTPSLATTSFASTGAPSQSSSATAPASRPAGADPNGDPERRPAGPPAQAMGLASAAGAAGGGGGGGGLSVLLLAALIGALALVPPPPGGRVRAYGRTLTSLLSSSRLERPG